MSQRPRIWLLLGRRRGDNNQLLALGEALGEPFETRTIHYNWQARLRMKLFRVGVGHITRASRRWLRPPWPDLIIGIGRRSVPVAHWIMRQSGGRAHIVRLGHPRAPSGGFDLVITTRQYPVPPADNVVFLPLAMNRFRDPPTPTAAEHAWLGALPRPHLLLSLGGTAPMWRLDMAALSEAAAKLARRANDEGGTLIVIGSPRTPPDAWDVVRDAAPMAACVEKEVRYPVLLADADAQFVTSDSVSMISEAVMSGKPVGLIAVEPDARGRRLDSDHAKTAVRDP
ncbi:MAG: ELM1/GtrOC1 family putative glycosyltransferase, partial [Sphingomicrobium sp.]